MVAAGAAVMVTLAVVVNTAQPPAAAMVYVTVYVPTVDKLGVMVPVAALMLNPAGEAVYVPPVVPVWVTVCGTMLVTQNGPAYEIVPLGAVVMVTLAVVVNVAQPPAAAMV
jgi:hypothetical protein